MTNPYNLDTDVDEGKIEVGLARGQRTTGGFDGPSWVPTLAERYNPDLKPDALKAKMEKVGKGSTARGALSGKLVAAFAWGRRVYFLDVTTKAGDVVRVKLPESKLLYRGLNLVELGAEVVVRYEGPGKPTKPGRKPPHLYLVSSVSRPALATPRADSLVAESIDEREARVARERAKEAVDLIDPRGADDDDHDDASAPPF